MLDINKIRKEPDAIKEALLKRTDQVDLERILELDKKNRELITRSEGVKAEKNRVSTLIASMKKKGEDIEGILKEMRQVNQQIGLLEEKISHLELEMTELMSALPNIPANHIPSGGKENNLVLKEIGRQRDFTFTPLSHMDLAESLNLIDYKRGAKLSGAGHWIYRGKGALLEWALLNYFLEEHEKDKYEFILPPHMLTKECGYTAGQFPKFQDEVFYLKGEKDKFILPTAETALVNLHRDEILKEENLPLKYYAYTPCYRKEAGSYRSEERGMIRGHQFNKVEMFQYTRPEDSPAALKELVKKVERLMDGLELHYRVVQLAAGDCGASMTETIDIEVWIPSMGGYKEVSSASSAGDYQARRGRIRYRDCKRGKNNFVHTLNASGLATSRLIPALLEQHQREDGSVRLPGVLQGRTGLGMSLSMNEAMNADIS